MKVVVRMRQILYLANLMPFVGHADRLGLILQRAQQISHLMQFANQPTNSTNPNAERQKRLAVFTASVPTLYASQDTANFLTPPSIREAPQGKLGGRVAGGTHMKANKINESLAASRLLFGRFNSKV